MIAATKLRHFLEKYAAERGLQRSSERAIGYALGHFERWLGRPPTVADLSADVLNFWLSDALDGGRIRKVTLKSYRLSLITLRRALAINGPVRPVKVPRRIPTAWSLEELRTLLATCADLRGTMVRCSGVQRAAFWRGFVLAGYHSGLRLGDLLRLKWEDVGDGKFAMVQAKTGDAICGRLPAESMEALSEIRHSGSRIFGSLLCRRNCQEYFTKILRIARLRGSPK